MSLGKGRHVMAAYTAICHRNPSLWLQQLYRIQFLIFRMVYYYRKNDQSRTTKMNGVFVLNARLKSYTGEKKPEVLRSFSEIPVG
jgi:hypothetical protein